METVEGPVGVGADGRATALEGEPALPAGFWRRTLALLLDLIVVILLLRVGDLLALPLARHDLVARAFLHAWGLVVPAAYFVLTHGTGGRTLGKQLAGVRVVGAAGEPIGYLWALGRLAAAVLSALLLGIGFLMVGLRRDKRGFHDLVADTKVIRVR